MKYFLLFAVCVLFASCSCLDIQKRHYRNGFYVNQSSRSAVNDPSVEPATAFVPVTNDQAETVNIVTVSDSSIFLPGDGPTVMSEVDVRPAPQAVNSLEKGKQVVQKEYPAVQKTATIPKDGGMESSTMITIGWVCAALAAVSLFVLWPLVFFVIPAVILLIIGYRKKNEGTEKTKAETLVDVVYLKNGSIIRGTIIEQVPNVSLKIQTSDGSVFFYKMEEVEKITKEKAVN